MTTEAQWTGVEALEELGKRFGKNITLTIQYTEEGGLVNTILQAR